MSHLYIDIETVPAQRLDVVDEIREGKRADLDTAIAAIRPPSNYGESAAAKWLEEKGAPQIQALRDSFDAEVEAAYRKTGLDGAFGQIGVVGFALDDGAPLTCFRNDWQDEAGVLRDFGLQLTELIGLSDAFTTTVVGHNVSAFDLRFLSQRSIVRGVRPHLVVARAASAKPWEADKVYDTMVQWAGVGNRISLDKLCKALGIPSPKGEIDGSKVWDFILAGRVSEVADYCKGDVMATREAHQRMTFALSPLQQFIAMAA